MSQLSFTVDTEDQRVVREVSEMLLRLSGHAELPMGTEPVVPHPQAILLNVTAADLPVVESITSHGIEFEPEEDVATITDSPIDSEGCVWDERIHSSSRETIQNGTWKLKRGVDKALVAKVKAELLGNGCSTPSPISEPTVTPKVEATTEQTPTPPPPPPPAPAQTVTGNTPATFEELMQRIVANKIPLQKLQAWCTEQGLGSFTLLGQAHSDRVADAAVALGV